MDLKRLSIIGIFANLMSEFLKIKFCAGSVRSWDEVRNPK